MTLPFQQTLLHSVDCVGIGLHSGNTIRMTLHPSAVDTGVVFVRRDVKNKNPRVAANYMNVSNTMLGTTLSNEEGVSVATVEHLMAAFWGCGIDNAIVELDGPEIPVMDGSSEPFVFLIECAGIKKQHKHRRMVEVLKKVEVSEDNKRVAIMPASSFTVSLEIDFNDRIISHQTCVFDSSDVSFKTDLCRARTFCFENEVDVMRSKGLALGGSLDNAIVVGKEGVINEGGLRYRDEFVRHKVLDCIGDFNLTGGAYLLGRLHGFRSGHAINNKLLRTFFADKDAWRIVEAPVEVTLTTVGNA
ncbi:MAG: UDP-3-O-acyl-N-acetylglucosamine deacetylase [Proteobacteria bacterium]|nr:UDP-3-O-acyl-N-acetylglucosamine deacetylase [Pseudomonadota bacterium]